MTFTRDYHRQQEEWLRQQLRESKETSPTHLLIFQHHPWFLITPDEDDEYFNIPKVVRLEMLRTFKENNVRAIFAGHYHRNAGGFDESLEMITTGPVGRPLGEDPSGLRIVFVTRDDIYHSYFSLDQVPMSLNVNDFIK